MREQQTSKERVAELAKLAADFFNSMPLQAVNDVDPSLAENFGRLMVENGYRVVFNRRYLQAEPKPTAHEPCATHAAEHRCRNELPCPWCVIDELKRNRDRAAQSPAHDACDAERYRWLRNQNIEPGTFPRPGIFIGRTMPDEVLSHQDADAAIDEARRSAPTKGGEHG